MQNKWNIQFLPVKIREWWLSFGGRGEKARALAVSHRIAREGMTMRKQERVEEKSRLLDTSCRKT